MTGRNTLNKEPLITVIIPVYNVESYIKNVSKVSLIKHIII